MSMDSISLFYGITSAKGSSLNIFERFHYFGFHPRKEEKALDQTQMFRYRFLE